jgi:2-octaprenyl-6-methoxyphenol hydroxylase
MTQSCDIAIVGGGLAGASLAVALAPLGYSVKVIEAVTFKSADQPSYDDRTLAVSHSSCRILSGLGLWGKLEYDATAIRKIFVSELDRPGTVVLDSQELGLTEFGHVVEARRFGATVTKAMAGTENIDVVCPATVTGFKTGSAGAELSLDTESGAEEIAARLVVAADGANSFLREHMNIPTQKRDYGQTAVICNVTPPVAHEGRAFECLTSTGPFAVLPHTGMRCGLVWSVASGDAQGLLEMDEAEFIERANARFTTALGPFVKAGRRSAYPLRLVRAKQDVRDRLVILGNAAHAIHPIGAQGFNLALRDVAILAEILADCDRDDPGNAMLLQQYSRWRRPDQRSTMMQSDGLTRLFAHPSIFAAGLRTAGIMAHMLSPGLRRQLANKAMGYRGRVPRLALGEPLSFA